jgi:hypothetical protein
MNSKKIFTTEINIESESYNTVGVVTLVCIIYLHADGTMRTLDINEALFNGKDIADYVSAAQSSVWDEWLEQAEIKYKEIHEEPAPVEHDDNDSGEGYLNTNIL